MSWKKVKLRGRSQSLLTEERHKVINNVDEK